MTGRAVLEDMTAPHRLQTITADASSACTHCQDATTLPPITALELLQSPAAQAALAPWLQLFEKHHQDDAQASKHPALAN